MNSRENKRYPGKEERSQFTIWAQPCFLGPEVYTIEGEVFKKRTTLNQKKIWSNLRAISGSFVFSLSWQSPNSWTSIPDTLPWTRIFACSCTNGGRQCSASQNSAPTPPLLWMYPTTPFPRASCRAWEEAGGEFESQLCHLGATWPRTHPLTSQSFVLYLL